MHYVINGSNPFNFSTYYIILHVKWYVTSGVQFTHSPILLLAPSCLFSQMVKHINRYFKRDFHHTAKYTILKPG